MIDSRAVTAILALVALLAAQGQFIGIKAGYIEARRSAAHAVAELERSVGTKLK